MATKISKRGSRQNRNDDVTNAAIKVFWNKGYPGASVQDVANEVGVLKGSLYHYIDSKEDLLFRIFTESHDQAMALMDQARQLDAPPLERLCRYLREYLFWYLTNLERASLYFTEWRYLTGERREIVKSQRKAYVEFVRETLTEAQRENEIADDLNLRYTVPFLLGALNAVQSWYRPDGADRPEDVVEGYLKLILSLVGNPTYELKHNSSNS